MSPSTAIPAPLKPTMQAVLDDYIGLQDKAYLVPADGLPIKVEQTIGWPQDRYLIGWSPWIGFDRGSIHECHLALFANGSRVFLRGPHKEAGLEPDAEGQLTVMHGLMYDHANPSEFYPAGFGKLIPAGAPITLQFMAHSTGNIAFNAQANAVVFSVIA